MTQYYVPITVGHPLDLASGQVIAPGEMVDLSDEDLEDPHNAALVETGQIVPTEEKATPKSKKGGDS